MRARALVASLTLIFSLMGAACGRGPEEASPTSTSAQPIAVGVLAPQFTLPSAQGGAVSLADFVGKKPVLLYFSMGPG